MHSLSLIFIASVFIAINGALGIMNGEYAMDNEFPYQVVIMTWYKEHICSGGIIDETHILTAAHCVYSQDLSDIMVGAGHIDFQDIDMTSKKVTEVHIPEGYVDGLATPDETSHLRVEAKNIAVLTVHPPFKWSNAFRRLVLPFENFTSCDVGVMAGWGENQPEEEYHLFLQWTYQRILEANYCEELATYHNADEFCTITPHGFGKPSDGDDGAPLVVNGIVVGIAAAIYEEDREGTRFTNVYNYQTFILDILGI